MYVYSEGFVYYIEYGDFNFSYMYIIEGMTTERAVYSDDLCCELIFVSTTDSLLQVMKKRGDLHLIVSSATLDAEVHLYMCCYKMLVYSLHMCE